MSDMDWANISDATPSLSWPPQPSHNITNDEIERLRADLASAIKQRDEAHSLIRTWKVNLVDVVDDGEIMYAMTSESRCSMNDAHKRAFLAATAKEGGGA